MKAGKAEPALPFPALSSSCLPASPCRRETCVYIARLYIGPLLG